MEAAGIEPAVKKRVQLISNSIECCMYVPTTMQHSIDQGKIVSIYHVRLSAGRTVTLRALAARRGRIQHPLRSHWTKSRPHQSAIRDKAGRKRFVAAKLTPLNVA